MSDLEELIDMRIVDVRQLIHINLEDELDGTRDPPAAVVFTFQGCSIVLLPGAVTDELAEVELHRFTNRLIAADVVVHTMTPGA